jgi:NAD(P)-dependent dehydrogenase (short-subunit alcohol dehydrogenase family)
LSPICFALSSGLGEAIVCGFVQAGAEIMVADRDRERAENVGAGCAGHGATLAFGDDISERKSADQLAEAMLDSASVSARHPAQDFPEEDWDRAIRVNLKGAFLTCQAFRRIMLKRGLGSIVNIALIGALAG